MKKWIFALLMVGFTAGTGVATAYEGHQSTSQPTHAAAPSKQGSSKPSKSAAVYTCPMHPEVRQDKPGKCSKCGMDLVAEKTADEKKPHHHDAPAGAGSSSQKSDSHHH